ncbi:MAG: metal-dependent hydrolase [Cardiobacteriaceae bacterium]|nr:metal-dependent hydrolase [Cardiobacteriaceae bacterium]
MDSLTQAVLGAAVQGAGMGKQQGRKALAYGAILGTLPDLDVLIRYADPVSSMTYHRGFTHSIFLLVTLAALIAWAVKKRWPDAPYTAQRLFWITAAALVTHPLIDACTVYGTQLLWPFTPTPQQWSAVFIIDPLYTVPMLAALIAILWRGITRTTHTALLYALTFSTAYLIWGGYGQWHHEHRVADHLQRQGIAVKRIMATPLPLNTLAFRVVAETDNGDYIEAISGWFDHTAPEHIRLPQGLAHSETLRDHTLYQRLHWFADGWLRIDETDDKLIVSDLRMGISGALTFRFVMAERTGDHWHNITPYRYGEEFPDLSAMMQHLWPRIWRGEALPLGEWAGITPPPKP